jgi:hypothetical protein
MHTKTHSNALAEKLNEEQTAQVFEWLSDRQTYDEVAKLISSLEPEGFGIQTSPAAVGRFARDHWDQIQKMRVDKLDIEVLAVNRHYDSDQPFVQCVDDANLNLLREKLFAVLNNTRLSPAELRSVASVLKVADNLARERSKDSAIATLAAVEASVRKLA